MSTTRTAPPHETAGRRTSSATHVASRETQLVRHGRRPEFGPEAIGGAADVSRETFRHSTPRRRNASIAVSRLAETRGPPQWSAYSRRSARQAVASRLSEAQKKARKQRCPRGAKDTRCFRGIPTDSHQKSGNRNIRVGFPHLPSLRSDLASVPDRSSATSTDKPFHAGPSLPHSVVQ